MRLAPAVRWFVRSFRNGLRLAAALALLFFGDVYAADGPADVTAQQIQALLLEKSARTPAQQKMDSQLLQAVRE